MDQQLRGHVQYEVLYPVPVLYDPVLRASFVLSLSLFPGNAPSVFRCPSLCFEEVLILVVIVILSIGVTLFFSIIFGIFAVVILVDILKTVFTGSTRSL